MVGGEFSRGSRQKRVAVPAARELSTTQERQSVAAAMGSLLQLAKTLPISGYDIVSAADIEDLIGERVAEPSAEDMREVEHEEEEKEEETKRKMSFALADLAPE